MRAWVEYWGSGVLMFGSVVSLASGVAYWCALYPGLGGAVIGAAAVAGLPLLLALPRTTRAARASSWSLLWLGVGLAVGVALTMLINPYVHTICLLTCLVYLGSWGLQPARDRREQRSILHGLSEEFAAFERGLRDDLARRPGISFEAWRFEVLRAYAPAPGLRREWVARALVCVWDSEMKRVGGVEVRG